MLHQPVDVVERIFTEQFCDNDWMKALIDSHDKDTLDMLSVVFMEDSHTDKTGREEDFICLPESAKASDIVTHQDDRLWQIFMNDVPILAKDERKDSRNPGSLVTSRSAKYEVQGVSSNKLSAESVRPDRLGAASRLQASRLTDTSETGQTPNVLSKRKRDSQASKNYEERAPKTHKMHRWTHEDVMQLIWHWCEASLEPTIEQGGTRVKKWKVINEKFKVGRPWSSEARIQAYFKTKIKGLYNFRVIYNHMLKFDSPPEEIDPSIYQEQHPKKSTI